MSAVLAAVRGQSVFSAEDLVRAGERFGPCDDHRCLISRLTDRCATRRPRGSSLPGPAGSAPRSAASSCRRRVGRETVRSAIRRRRRSATLQPASNVIASGEMPATSAPTPAAALFRESATPSVSASAAGDDLVSVELAAEQIATAPEAAASPLTRTGRQPHIVKRSKDCPGADRAADRRAERCRHGRRLNAPQRATGRHRARGRSHRHGCYDHIGRRGYPHPKRDAGREIVEVRDRRDQRRRKPEQSPTMRRRE
jgi:hypothetical protein